MQKIITKTAPTADVASIKRKKTAAYCRVSCDKDTMLHSLAAQIEYYRTYIMGNPEWVFVGVYADEAKTGTKESREQFQYLLAECQKGNVDQIITKSISRFARNTVTVLKTVRELMDLGVDVFFEEQNMHTLGSEGELMLTLLAACAEAESYSCSENCKWRIRKGFEHGRASCCTMLGYRLKDGEFAVRPEEAETVRRIYDLYEAGYGLQRICNALNAEGVRTRLGCIWHRKSVQTILSNEKYMGDLKLQKTYVSDHISKKRCTNIGQRTIYYIEEDHEPIVDKTQFDTVQQMLESRSRPEKAVPAAFGIFSGKIRCEGCGKNYRRKITATGIVWCCSTFNTRGKKYCMTSKAIPEETLKLAAANVLGLSSFAEDSFSENIDHIDACADNLLRFCFKDNSYKEYTWFDRSRSRSWTPEMREQARQRALNRRAE